MLNDSEISGCRCAELIRDLEIEISFLEGLVRRLPSDIEALQVLGDHYCRLGRYGDSLRIDQRLATLCPDDQVAFYNLGCSLCRNGQLDAAADALIQAIDLGFRDDSFLDQDPDLSALRAHHAFQRVARHWKRLAPTAG